jgi:hypothetical protein
MGLGQHANDMRAARRARHTLTAAWIFRSMTEHLTPPLFRATRRAMDLMTSVVAS